MLKPHIAAIAIGMTLALLSTFSHADIFFDSTTSMSKEIVLWPFPPPQHEEGKLPHCDFCPNRLRG